MVTTELIRKGENGPPERREESRDEAAWVWSLWREESRDGAAWVWPLWRNFHSCTKVVWVDCRELMEGVENEVRPMTGLQETFETEEEGAVARRKLLRFTLMR